METVRSQIENVRKGVINTLYDLLNVCNNYENISFSFNRNIGSNKCVNVLYFKKTVSLLAEILALI